MKRPNFLSHLRRTDKAGSQDRVCRPPSPLIAPVHAPPPGKVLQDVQESEGNPSPTKRSPQVSGDNPADLQFRTRAASAGQQAKAHVSQIVARFRNRSNSNTADEGGPRKKYRIVGATRSGNQCLDGSGGRGSLEPEARKRTSSLSTPHRAVDVS